MPPGTITATSRLARVLSENGLCYCVRHVRTTGRLLPPGENPTSVAPNSIWSLSDDGGSLPVRSDGSQIKFGTTTELRFGVWGGTHILSTHSTTRFERLNGGPSASPPEQQKLEPGAATHPRSVCAPAPRRGRSDPVRGPAASARCAGAPRPCVRGTSPARLR